jgi:hypothetical protein
VGSLEIDLLGAPIQILLLLFLRRRKPNQDVIADVYDNGFTWRSPDLPQKRDLMNIADLRILCCWIDLSFGAVGCQNGNRTRAFVAIKCWMRIKYEDSMRCNDKPATLAHSSAAFVNTGCFFTANFLFVTVSYL